MDFLKQRLTPARIVFGVGFILISGLAIIAGFGEQPMNAPSRPADVPAGSPVAPAPSKENVSKSVQERITHLKEVVAKNPADATTAFELARTLQDGHDVAGAIAYFEKGLKAAPRDLAARVDYSLCLYQTGRFNEAFDQNRLVLRVDAQNAQALYNLGALHANTGRNDSAAYYWTRLVKAHPQDELARAARQNLTKLDGSPQAM
jgi:tetratricopeptide (TPR) repeat protein